ncbi:MAG: site-specific DNA-methyltransferase [Chlorobiaceae bacterium]|nr:site-specific DNA-methyltransferase [Chlorobiaceae bacterium]
MKLYYQDDAVTIYHGDCREVMPQLDGFDFSFTDPPYNVGKNYGQYDDRMPENKYFEWCDEWISMISERSNMMAVYPPKIYIRWFLNRLPDHHLVIATWNPYGAIRGLYVHQYAPLLLPKKPYKKVQDHWGGCMVPGCGYFFTEKTYGHPGYTSEHITRLVIDCCSVAGQIILDPFGGTGTTGRAAKDLGRKAVLIEQNERYCEIAACRMGQEVLL